MMTRGRVDLGGHEIAMTTNAMVRYQERAGETIFAAFTALESNNFDPLRLRRMIWAALIDRSKSEDDAGEIMDAVGIKDAAMKLADAVRLAFPEASEGNAQEPSKK